MCSNSLTIWQIYTKFLSCLHLIRIQHILPGFFIWPTFQGHRGQTLKFLRSAPTLNYQADLHQIFNMDASNKDIYIAYYPGFWFHLLFKVTEVKLWNFYDLLQHLNYPADLHQIFIDTSNKDTSHITPVFVLMYFSMSQRSNFDFLWSGPTP
jgi:hypothetical protein